MDDREKILAGLLRAKRESFPPSAGFDESVMASVRESARMASRKQPAGVAREPVLERWLRVLRSLAAATPRRALWAPACLAVLAAAYLAVMPRQGLLWKDGDRDGDDTRIKGEEFRFGLVIKESEEGIGNLRRLKDGDRLRAGDRIQALYWLSDSAYVELLSLDERGKVQCYSCGNPAAKQPPGVGLPLPFALELDNTPGSELFVLAGSSRARPGGQALRAALESAWKAAGGDLRRTSGGLEGRAAPIRFRSFLIRKGTRT